jgi:hypothetical protein
LKAKEKFVRLSPLGVEHHPCHSTNAENFAIIQLSSISGAEDHPVKRMPMDHVVHTANFQVMLFVRPTNGIDHI